jgi:hypothetical protein
MVTDRLFADAVASLASDTETVSAAAPAATGLPDIRHLKLPVAGSDEVTEAVKPEAFETEQEY